MTDRLRHLADWNNAKRAVAMCLRFKTKLVEGVRRNAACDLPPSCTETFRKDIDVEELLNAEKEIVRNVQKEAFKSELINLKAMKENSVSRNRRNGKLKRLSSLSRFDPFIDSDNIVRVGGRVAHAELPDSVEPGEERICNRFSYILYHRLSSP